MAEAYICDGVRSPIGRYAGALSGIRTDDLAALPIKALRERSPRLPWDSIDDVVFGCANQAGEDNRNVARMALLLAGLPTRVPGTTVNRLCGSGLEALSQAARAVKLGEAQMIIAGGVESMSRAPFVMGKSAQVFARTAEIHDTTIGWRFVNKVMHERFGTESMPETAENVAEERHISRQDQDKFALRSQQRAAKAMRSGRFKKEIVPAEIARHKQSPLVVAEDEHPRPDTTLDGLAELPTPFRADGTVTAGNASGINDGACALLVASEAAAQRHGLKPIARVVGTAVEGVPPRIMGMGPVPATKKVLEMTGLTLSDIGVIELNEAFAAQALAVMRELGLADDSEHVNPNGGAIALGHPLGMSGVRLALTAAIELRERGERYALCTMCIGVGQGIAMVLERM